MGYVALTFGLGHDDLVPVSDLPLDLAPHPQNVSLGVDVSGLDRGSLAEP